MVQLVVTDRDGKVVEVEGEPGDSVMEAIRDLDASVEAICGGMCSCATCHCLMDINWAEHLPPRSDDELELLEELEAFDPARSRLSCQIPVTEDLDGLTLTVGPEE